MWEFVLRPFHGERYVRARRIGDKTVTTLGSYMRGTATVAFVDAVGILIGLLILQVPLAFPLAVLVFLLAFIPIVGAVVAGILAALAVPITAVAWGIVQVWDGPDTPARWARAKRAVES
jgi:putative heme transporter